MARIAGISEAMKFISHCGKRYCCFQKVPSYEECIDLISSKSYNLWNKAGRPEGIASRQFAGENNQFWTRAEEILFDSDYREMGYLVVVENGKKIDFVVISKGGSYLRVGSADI